MCWYQEDAEAAELAQLWSVLTRGDKESHERKVENVEIKKRHHLELSKLMASLVSGGRWLRFGEAQATAN